ncbi:MAG: hypothetical protein AMXMBFR13_43080 [Phycisphaerae bacterium]
MCPARLRTRGFTLIEILVVVAVIALLLAILLPSLSNARQQARRLVCRNNLRSIWTGIISYTIVNRDRLPFMEDVNLTNPDADPFDPAYRTTVGRVLFRCVNPESWRCPSAVAGFPRNKPGNWKMTYTFSAAGKIGSGVPYNRDPQANTQGVLDPAVSNYVHFDGRPLRLLDGRRYVQGPALNHNKKGWWNIRRAIIAEALAGQPASGKPQYPHYGQAQVRTDLGNARQQFETNTFTAAVATKPVYHELHADKDQADVLLTRYWVPHWPGY